MSTTTTHDELRRIEMWRRDRERRLARAIAYVRDERRLRGHTSRRHVFEELRAILDDRDLDAPYDRARELRAMS